MAQVYFNKVQRLVQLIGAKVSVIVAGRRTGKTYGIAAPFSLRNMQRMPGSTGGIVVPTYKHGLTNTLPGLFNGWKTLGFVEGIHYVVGIKPPKHFKKPIIEPREYQHVVSFYNGSIAVLISQDRPGTSNSLTLDWLLIDEAKFINFEKLKDETFPANGGIKSHFGMHSYHHSIMILSDMPCTSKGSWFMNYREKMDVEVIRAIESLVANEWNMKQRIRQLRKEGKDVPDYLKAHLKMNNRKLNKLRSVAIYYKEYSSLENIELIGPKYIAEMKRDLTPLVFRTSILCQRIGNLQEGFYNSMKPKHEYDASNFEYLDSLGYGKSEIEYKRLMNAQADRDVNPNAPICIGMDYNANINWIVAGQPDYEARKLFVLKSFYVKYEKKIPAVVADFCKYYIKHLNKTVIFYYDSTALGSNYAVSKKDFKWTIENCFRKNGWKVISVYLGNPMRHSEKYLLINEGFDGHRALEPFFNRENNQDLLAAIHTAGVSRGRNGFQKDKSGEKLAETEEDKLENRTDGTDAFDTLFIGCTTRPQSRLSSVFIAGTM